VSGGAEGVSSADSTKLDEPSDAEMGTGKPTSNGSPDSTGSKIGAQVRGSTVNYILF